jgi:predicted ArsR family transcriptional regulator
MTADLIAENARWLDDIITHQDNASLFRDEKQMLIQQELTGRWAQENRLELLRGLADRFGEGAVLAVIDTIIEANSRRDWEHEGEKADNSLRHFIELLWLPLKNHGFEFSFTQEGTRTIFCVTRCPLYDLAKEIGAEKWFYHLFCLTDEPSVTGFNNKIAFSRTRTLMQGYPDCDHCYTDLSLE